MPGFFQKIKPDFIGEFTWVNKPSASVFPGKFFFCTDVGINGSLWYSNGTEWIHDGKITFIKMTLPVGIPSGGSIGDNGALTLTTATIETYPKCFMYFPANAISAGSAAGVYYVEMSTTTAGTIYNNPYTSGHPAFPASPTAFSTTGPGAYTQTVNEITLLTFTLPGGVLSANGGWVMDRLSRYANSADSKRGKVYAAGQEMHVATVTTTTQHYGRYHCANVGAVNRQITNVFASGASSSAGAIANKTVDFSADVSITITGERDGANDHFFTELLLLEISP